jgi:hypothetical protein
MQKTYYLKALDEKHALLKEAFPWAASTCEGCKAAENCVHKQVADTLGYVIGKCDLKNWGVA